MAPKTAQKSKKEATKNDATTPVPSAIKPKAPKSSKTANPVKKAAPKAPTLFQAVPNDETRGPIPVEATYKGESHQARLVKGDYTHTLELKSPRPFSLVKTIMMPEGEYEGLQALILKPSKAFPFLRLPDEVRGRIYAWYFAPGGVLNGEIPLEAKRKDTKNIYARSYADGSPNRVALLRVNKEVYASAVQYLYANTLQFESTTTLLDFLGQIDGAVRSRLTGLFIKAYVKTTSRNAMHFLAEAGNIQRLHIDSGIFSECDPKKAAKTFHADAYKFLEAIAATKGSKSAGVDVLTFGKHAFTRKDEQKNAKPWTENQVAEFRTALKEKMSK